MAREGLDGAGDGLCKVEHPQIANRCESQGNEDMKEPLLRVPRIPLRWRILLPFLLLAVVLLAGLIWLSTDLIAREGDVSFSRQLRDSGQRTTDSLVRIEEELLTVERTIANTDGVAEAVARADAEDLRARILPLVINADVDAVTILDREGTSLLSIRRSNPDSGPGEYASLRGEGFYAQWPFVRELLDLDLLTFFSETEEGDKRAGLGELVLDQESIHVLYVGGPLLDEQGTVFGGVLVGVYSPHLVEQLSEAARANVSLYGQDGMLLSTVFTEDSTWDPPGLSLSGESIEASQDPSGEDTPLRDVRIAGQPYGEVLTPFLVRGGSVNLGYVGVALLRSEEDTAVRNLAEGSSRQILLITGFSALAVLLVAVVVSNSIAQPIDELRAVTKKILAGEQDVVLPEPANDELGELVQTLTSVAVGLKQGSFSTSLQGSHKTTLPLIEPGDGWEATEGLQRMKASILILTLTQYEPETERRDAERLSSLLNHFLDTLVPIVERHDGVLQRVEGDHFLVSFGLPPRRLPASVSAFLASHAALDLKGAAGQDAGYSLSMGLATGFTYVGQLGTKDRLHFGVFGDTVDVARQIEAVARTGSGGNLLVGAGTYDYISRAGAHFTFGRRGKVQLRQGREKLIYELQGRVKPLLMTKDDV